VPGQAAGAHPEPDSERPPPRVEEDEIEPEAHAEGVDAGAAWQQQTRPGLLPSQSGEPEQAGAVAAGERDVATEDPVPRE
jgi:hypothetical protein